MGSNPKSDVDAKAAYVAHLLGNGFETAKVTGSPADITAIKGGETHFFEIKFTRQQKKYFGAATLTEWEAALNNKDRFKFVIAFQREGNWEFHEYSPDQFMTFSYIPPFKVFFNVLVGAKKDQSNRDGSQSVRLTPSRIQMMSELYSNFREPGAV
jgi:hypothetical protein